MFLRLHLCKKKKKYIDLKVVLRKKTTTIFTHVFFGTIPSCFFCLTKSFFSHPQVQENH